MGIQFDDAKRARILAERGLDIAQAGTLFDGFHLTRRDDKHSTETEERFNSVGMLGDEIVLVTWTSRGAARRIVTMWKANDKERQSYQRARGRGG
jgi:uncharacterized DUF497 family protein